MEIWNEEKNARDKRTQKSFETRQFNPRTREARCTASQCETNKLPSMLHSISRKK